LQDFTDLVEKPVSILAYHNRFADQVRRSFVAGGYYPALVAACALGERILNHLMLDLRDYFKGTAEYKKVHRKNAFDNWELAIATLEAWGVLVPDVVQAFRQLANIRNRRAIHFDPASDKDDRPLALQAIRQLDEVIAKQFGVSGSELWFISDIKGGESFIKKEYETNPFIREVYLAKSFLVGPRHELEYQDGSWLVHDDNQYEEREISDEEFRKLRLDVIDAPATAS
jgi:hypothetical protein